MDEVLIQFLNIVDFKRRIAEEECAILKSLLKPWPRSAPESQNTKIADKRSQENEISEASTLEERRAVQQLEKLLTTAERLRKKAKDLEIAESAVIKDDENKAGIEENQCLAQSTEEQVTNNVHAPETKDCLKQKKKIPKPSTEKLRDDSYKNIPQSSLPKTVSDTNSKARIKKLPSANSKQVLWNERKCKSSRHIPAHATAPFKTDAEQKFSHRPSNKSIRPKLSCGRKQAASETRSEQNSAREALREDHYKTLPNIKRTDEANLSSSQVNDHVSETESSSLPCEPVKCVSGIGSKNTVANTEKDETEKKAPVLQVDQLQLFQEKDEFDITLPPKLVKLVTENSTLRDKCLAASVTKKVSTSDPSQRFFDNLEAQISIGDRTWQQVRALTSFRSHKILLDTLKDLNLKSLTEKSCYIDIFKAKKTLEFILNAFSELQDEADYISTVNFQKKCVATEEPKSDKNKKIFFSNASARGTNPRLFNELVSSKQWTKLKFDHDLLELQLEILAVADSMWWPVLQNLEKGYQQLLPSIYSLITSIGEFSPVFISTDID